MQWKDSNDSKVTQKQRDTEHNAVDKPSKIDTADFINALGNDIETARVIGKLFVDSSNESK